MFLNEKIFFILRPFYIQGYWVWFIKTKSAMRKLILPFLLISVGLVSCKKEKEDLSGMQMGNNFYPTQIGKYIVYNYDSTVYDDVKQLTAHLTGQVRYYVADTFRDADGRLAYTVKVQKRANDTDPYLVNDVITVTPTDDHVEMEQKTLTFIKLAFPVANGKSWNGNALLPATDNDSAYDEFNKFQQSWNYTYSDYDTDFQPNAKLYEHTVTVNEISDTLGNPDTDSTAYAYKNFSKEIYAYNVGLIYKERTYWEYKPEVGYRKGYSVILKAVDNN